MAALPVILQVAGTAMAAAGAIKQGQAASDAATYNSQVAQINAQVADSQSIAASEAQGRDAQRRIGAATAAFGASGVQLSDGSASDVLAESARNAALDNLTLKYNYKLKRMGLLDQAGLEAANAKNASAAGYLSAAGAVAAGAGKAYSMSGGGAAIPQMGGNPYPYSFGYQGLPENS